MVLSDHSTNTSFSNIPPLALLQIGFRGQSSVVHKLACSNHLPLLQKSAQIPNQPQQQSGRGGGHVASAGGGGGGVIDILAAPSRITLGVQAHLLEKQGLCIADQLREARQVSVCMCVGVCVCKKICRCLIHVSPISYIYKTDTHGG